jgi:dTMP kinase
VVAHSLRGLGDDLSWRLREDLAPVSPFQVARSVEGPAVECPRADATRIAMVDAAPQAVLATLDRNDTPAAWALRERLLEPHLAAVVASLKRLDHPKAWSLRERYLAEHGERTITADPLAAAPLAASLRGLGGAEAWRLRRACFDAAPIAVLESLTGLADEESWTWRARHLERAPRVVLRSLLLLDDPRAWQMRRSMVDRAKEALDSMAGMASANAWSLREQAVSVWPSTAVKSLGPLFHSRRGQDLARRALTEHPNDLSLLKHVTALGGDRPAAEPEAAP